MRESKRTVKERVEEFREKKSPQAANMTVDEFKEIYYMQDAYETINTAFLLGYIKGMNRRKAVRHE